VKNLQETLLPPVANGRDSAVLCVDDEPLVLAALTRTLGREPYEILRAADAVQALEMLDVSPVKVVIADERMPGMSGSALLSEVRRRWPLVGRIILTGYPGQGILIRSLEAEVDFLLYKPWDEAMLRKTIRRLIDEVDRAIGPEGLEGSWDLGGEG
jgi:response regulator RpfG family c-di-GMP phosphodiesterase